MENKEQLLDELDRVNNQLNNVIDDMISTYGKFISFKDVSENDKYMIDLVSSYNKANEERTYLENQLNLHN